MSDGNVPVEASDRQSVLAQASPETERRSPRSLHNKEGAGPVRAGSPAVFTPKPPLTGLRGAGLRNPRHRLQGPGLYLPAFSFLPLSPPGFPQPQAKSLEVTQWPCRPEVLGRAEWPAPLLRHSFPRDPPCHSLVFSETGRPPLALILPATSAGW